MKIRIEPYNYRSKGSKAMARNLGLLRATQRQVRRHGDFDLILNWGSTQRRFNGEYINNPEAVARACDKKASLELFQACNVPIPDWTTEAQVAEEWLHDGNVVVVRKLLRANSGRGIVLVHPSADGRIPHAPLYTKYIKKADEYRVHVFGGKVLDVQQKRKRQCVDNADVNYQVRNARNGWVFCRGGVAAHERVIDAGVRAVAALDLDFGAADVGWNARNESATVYEVNTAPGVEGSTLEAYRTALTEAFPELAKGAYVRRRNAWS